MRSFIGIDCSEEWRRALSCVSDVFRTYDERWNRARWVPRDNLHVTLKFLGELDAEALDALADDLIGVCARIEPFDLPLLDPVVAARSKSRATMLWTLLDDSDSAAADLVAELSDAATAYGVTPEARDYVPHITLVRFRRPSRVDGGVLETASSAVRDGLGTPEPAVSVREVTLYTSTLTREGAIYTRHARIRLGIR